MPSYKAREGVQLGKEDIAERITPFVSKYAWFLSNGYVPHYWQTLFHTMRNGEKLCRFRHLVAGRRGGKTLSAAWEVVFYALHPTQFHLDAHGVEKDDPLHIWVLTKDYPTGMAALMAVRLVLKAAGLTHGVEYKENRGNRWFEFENGSFLQFKTADDPESLRGAGLDLLWMDEAAFITDARPWEVTRPALADKVGLVVSSTTPSGKNWFYDEFWNVKSLENPDVGRVEYWSIDNPYFPKVEWDALIESYHPLLFKQEFCAAFDSMAGKELHGDWLHYYQSEDIPRVKDDPKKLDLDIFIGIDPAISLSDSADKFAMCVIGITKDGVQAFILDTWLGRIPFPEQLEMIQLWHQKWRPKIIGIESNVYQVALVQQSIRLPNLPPIIPVLGRGKKTERILSMSSVFRIGKVKIRKDMNDFIDQWLDYDSQIKNPKDDLLDAAEIAIKLAGALLPSMVSEKLIENPWDPYDIERWAWNDLPKSEREKVVDEHMGSIF